VAALSTLQLFIKGLSAVWTFYLARRLGVLLYGLWANVLALTSIFGVLQGYGILSIVVREVSQKRDKAREYLGASFLVYALASLTAFTFILLSGLFLGYSSTKIVLTAIAGFSFIAFAPGLACQSVLYGLEHFTVYMTIFSIGTLAYMILGIMAVELNFGVIGVFIALCMGYTLSSSILMVKIKSIIGGPVFLNAGKLSASLIRLGYPLVFSAISIELMLRADRILIDHFLGEEAVGYFHAAFNIVYLPREIIFVPLGTAVYTRLSSTYLHDRPSFNKLFERLNIILLLATLPVGGICLLFPYEIIAIFYGQDYYPSARILMILVWMLIPLFISGAWQNMMIIQNRTKAIFKINFVGAVLNILFNYFFLPRWGLIASPVAALAAQSLVMVLSLYLLRNEQVWSFAARLPRIFLAFALTTVILYLVRPPATLNHLQFLGFFFGGTALYLLFYLIFRVVNAEELAWIKNQLVTLGETARNKILSVRK